MNYQGQKIDINRKEFVEYAEIKDKSYKSSPLHHVNGWDFVIMFFAVLIRFVVVANRKIKEYEHKGEEFDYKKYFDFKHIVRWSLHVLCAFVGILVLPELFVSYIQPKYFSGLESWTVFGSGMIGFLGYDLVRWIEKITFAILDKMGLKV
jgi:hypothetical protein